jgi:hypothetical protein
MQLKYRDCGRWEQEGESLVWTKLKETAIPTKVQEGITSLLVVIPDDMLFIAGLKLGDYVEWGREGNLLSLRKTEGAGTNPMKIRKISGTASSVAVTIPKAVAEELKVEKGMYGLWTFDENGLWLKLSKENPRISRIYATSEQYWDDLLMGIPEGFGEHIGKGDLVILEPKDGKLYLTKKMEARI